MSNIEAKRYIASDADIRQLATDSLQARSSLDKTRSTYLRALIGTTQAEVRETKAPMDEQLSIARRVHRRFFEIVKATVMKDVKPAHRSREQQRRTGFARSASSTLNSWLKVAGHDLMKLKPEEVTKGFLAKQAAPRNPHMPTEARTRAKTHRYLEGLIASVKPYAAVDSSVAREILQEAVNQLTGELRKLTPIAHSVSTMTSTRIARGQAKRTLSKKAA